MNTKNGKRSRRRTDDDASPDYKPPSSSKEKLDKLRIKIDESEEVNKIVEEAEKIEAGIKTRGRAITPQNLKKQSPSKPGTPTKLNDSKTAPKDDTKSDECIIIEDSAPVESKSTTNGTSTSKETTETNGVVIEIAEATETANGEKTDVIAAQEVDEMEGLEPLVMEAEDIDPELQFDENSDADESPVLTRCKTRRSQTRNIPTPKTPKSFSEQNGEEAGNSTPDIVGTPELPSSTPDVEPKAEQTTEETKQPEIILPDLNETTESAISTKVNVGDDYTRDELDLTSAVDDKESFLNQNKNLTVVETIRKMSARRSIRQVADYRRGLLRSKAEKQDIPYPTARSSVERLSGAKRKNRSESPDGVKRYKVESSAGLLAYISSPFSKIKNRFVSGEVSASTPKLTSYKKQDNILEDADISKIENETNTSEKKWCVIM